MLVGQQRKTVGKKRILCMAKLHNCMMPKHWLESLSEARLSRDEMTFAFSWGLHLFCCKKFKHFITFFIAYVTSFQKAGEKTGR